MRATKWPARFAESRCGSEVGRGCVLSSDEQPHQTKSGSSSIHRTLVQEPTPTNTYVRRTATACFAMMRHRTASPRSPACNRHRGGLGMTLTVCQHLVGLSSASFPSPATPGACEDCLREGTTWVELRLCRECGHVGCCDSSPQRHATRHFQATGHPVIRAITPASAEWTWCYVHGLTRSLAASPHSL